MWKFVCLWLLAGGAAAQVNSPPPSAPRMSASMQAQKGSMPTDDFAGLDLTDPQKANIDKIRKNYESRREIVTSDERLNAEQRQAMSNGLWRLENSEIYKALTPDQQLLVRKRIYARQSADRQEDQAQKKRQMQMQTQLQSQAK